MCLCFSLRHHDDVEHATEPPSRNVRSRLQPRSATLWGLGTELIIICQTLCSLHVALVTGFQRHVSDMLSFGL
jgi:hypothetical protein